MKCKDALLKEMVDQVLVGMMSIPFLQREEVEMQQ
jgi:hypothetical protein